LIVARLVISRLLQAVVVVLVVATLTFALIRIAPGDPFAAALDNPNVTADIRAEWRSAYGLDQSIPEQYLRYLGAIARGDFGWSFSMQRPVSEAVAAAFPKTLLLMGTGLVVSFAAGVALALIQAGRPGSVTDRAVTGASLFVYSLPDFWLALMLLLIFALGLGVLPAGGAADPLLHDQVGGWDRALDTGRHLLLPASTLALIGTAMVARYQRGALLDVLPQDFIRTARAKGAAEGAVLRRHALRNALLPTLTLLGLSIPALFGGSVFVEKIFAWPGMGLLAVNAVATRDYALVTAVVVIVGMAVVAGNLLADVLYAIADPRLRDA
jgi:peptide/nickel transport system permease protein